MRKTLWITCLMLVAIGLLLLSRKAGHQEMASQPSDAIQKNESTENISAQPTVPEFSNNPTSSSSGISDSNTNRPSSSERGDQRYRQALNDWQVPIDFYGQVVDENSIPVEGANIEFGWSESPTQEGEKSESTKSDVNGFFSLHGKRGPTLEVKVSKDGYYTSRATPTGFHYALANEKHAPDPATPVVYHLRKKKSGDALIEKDFPPGMGQRAQLSHDGTPVELDLIKAVRVPAGNGQLKLEFWRDLSDKNAQKFDWKFQMSVLGGGLARTGEEFAFEAPESGYQPDYVVEMPATNQAWAENMTTKFYVRFSDGEFGRIDFRFSAYNGVFSIHTAINPSGSRNLEPKSGN